MKTATTSWATALVVLVGMGRVADGANPVLTAPSFRVETDVYEGESNAPQSQHLILFDSGVIYDLPVARGEIVTVFDIPRNRVVLVHKTSRVRSSIDTETLVQMTAQVRSAAAERGTGATLGLDATMIASPDQSLYTLQFGSTRYEVQPQTTSDPVVASEFAAFTSWAARLNIALRIGPPPFAAMTIADELARDGRMPRKVKVDLRRGLTTRTYRSEHIVVERLSDFDRKKISDVGGMIAMFEEVAFSEFPND